MATNTRITLATWLAEVGRNPVNGRIDPLACSWAAQVVRDSSDVRRLEWDKLALGGGIILQDIAMYSQLQIGKPLAWPLVGWGIRSASLLIDGQEQKLADKIRWNLAPLLDRLN